MHLKPYIHALAGAFVVTASTMRCGTAEPSEEQLQISRRLQAVETDMKQIKDVPTNIEINAYFHVITNPMGLRTGEISSYHLVQQLNVLNNAFNPHNITFSLAGNDTTTPEHWGGGCHDKEMKSLWNRLRNGTYADLNVYFVPNIFCVEGSQGSVPVHDIGVGGYVYDFPEDVEPRTPAETYDSVNVLADTVPGGNIDKFNEGDNLVHEVGHWLGLYHTFHGGCEGEGDYIDDTPAESQELSDGRIGECDHNRDTCKGAAGKDPVDNYMSYSSDSCRTRFTPGQVTRMFTEWTVYRAKHQTHAR